MVINTTRFGKLEVSPDTILHMPHGMLGIDSYKQFILINNDKCPSLKWLQAIDEPSLAFIVTNPMDFFPDYDIELSDDDIESIELDNPADVAVVTTVTFDRGTGLFTTNLMGPIVLNSKNYRAKQIVVQDDRYSTRHAIGKIPGTVSVPRARA